MTAGGPVVPGGGRCSNCGGYAATPDGRCASCGPAASAPPVPPPPVQQPYGQQPAQPFHIQQPYQQQPYAQQPPQQPYPPQFVQPTYQPVPYGPPRRNPNLPLFIGGGVAALIGLVLIVLVATGGSDGGIGGSAKDDERTITGTVNVYDTSASGCYLSPGYGDMHSGALVTVSDSSGDTIGTTTLGPGHGTYPCTFDFEVEDLPDSSSYGFQVGHRNVVEFDRGELSSNDWEAVLTLGRN